MDSQPPQKLDYQAPAPRPGKGGPKYLASRLISSYIGYLLVMGVLIFFVPKFSPVFMSFQMKVPAPTRMLLRASELCVRDYLWAILLPVPALWALANFAIPNPLLRRRLRLTAFLIVAAFLIFTLFALFLPLLSLIQNVNSPKP
jgi:hypothetical protein